MTPLLFALAVTVLGPSDALPPGAHLPNPSTLPLMQRNALTAAACVKLATKTVGPDGAPLKKLGELPPGLLEHAVLRSVNGCPVREIVFAGQTYYLDAQPGRIERIDPVAPSIKQR